MPKHPPLSRRQFLKATGAAAGTAALASVIGRTPLLAADPPTFSVAIIFNAGDPIVAASPVRWAAWHLQKILTNRGVTLKPAAADVIINVASAGMRETAAALDKAGIKLASAPETIAILPTASNSLLVTGSDHRGIIYALTELADRVELATNVRAALSIAKPLSEKPANPIRGIFRMFVSETEDKRWYYDRELWQRYFDNLVTQRFNRFNLSFGLSYDFSRGLTDVYTFFAYPFFVNVPGYGVKAIARGGAAVPPEEQQKNLDTLKFISDQAALRGLDFNLGLWTHSYTWTNSPNATHTIQGLNAQTQAPYSRDAMRMMLNACPGITGVTLRTHGESGVPEGSYDLWKIIMSGITGLKDAAGKPRVLELDLHAKTMTQEMIDTALTTGMPLTLSSKFWAEHMGLPYVQSSIREQEMPKGRDAGGLMSLSSGTRSFLRYGIGDLLSKDRKYKVIHRVWPGTQRLLLWGDPLYAAEYGRAASFAGMDGIEYFEPLSFRGRAGSSMTIPPAPDRSGYADASLRVPVEEGGDVAKYNYTLRLLGRLSYNPDADPESWRRSLNHDFGPAAVPLETALASVSRILPLITTAHDPAAANAQYWPEIYTNMSLYDPARNPYSEAPSPKVFGNVTSLDPQMFASITEYVDALLADKQIVKATPLQVVAQLDQWANTAREALSNAAKQIADAKFPGYRRHMIDTSISAGIGAFFAAKMRSGILWSLFDASGHEPARQASLAAYRDARKAWSDLSVTAAAYVDDLTFGADRQLRGHWKERLADIDADITGMSTRMPAMRGRDYAHEAIDKIMSVISNSTSAGWLDKLSAADPRVNLRHTPPENFNPGNAVNISLTGTGNFGGRLLYRHIHQGQRYESVPLSKDDAGLTANIPAEYTKSAFHLQYYFELQNDQGIVMYPGFKENFTGQPYFVVKLA
ncbi:MAG TPA: twin-arginine translocation signal domain-containing protein [Phycisphaerae bacterium]|jgi:hypothetical protein